MKSAEKKLLYHDCMKVTRLSCFLYMVQECSEGLLTVFIANLIGSFADAVFALDLSYARENLWRLLICLCVTLLIVPLMTVIADRQCFKNTLKYERMLLCRFFEKDYADAMHYELGEVSQRLEEDGIEFRTNIMNIFSKSVTSVATLVALLILAFPVSPAFTGIVFFISLVKLLVPIAVRKLDKKYDKQTREYQDQVAGMDMELTAKPYAVKMMGLDAPFRQKLEDVFRQYFRSTLVHRIRCKRCAGGISSLLDVLCTVVILFLGALFVASDLMSPGSVAAMVGYFSIFNTLMDNWGKIIRMVPILGTLSDRLMIFYEKPEPVNGENIGEIKTIAAESMEFSYPDAKIISNLSFNITCGQKVAIVGENGSGKSTLVKILGGLLRKTGGTLRFNGVDVENLSIESRRSRIAYAEQAPYLFHGTVRENIRLGKLAATDDEVEALTDTLRISSLCARKVTGDEELSGGEKQKISIVRALLRNPDVILLDEPSNHMDAETKNWLMNFIRTSTKTIVYISHDSDLTSCADDVIYL